MKVGKAQFNHRRKMYFLFGKLCCSCSPWLLSPSPHLFPLTLRPFSHWEASDNLYCRHKYPFQVSSREYILSHASTLLGVLTLHASLCPCVPGFNSAKYLCRDLTVQKCLTPQMSSMHLILRIHSTAAGRSPVFVTVFS